MDGNASKDGAEDRVEDGGNWGNPGSGYVLAGYRGSRPVGGGIVYSRYVPVLLDETDEERMARVRRERAGKTFARVKRSNPNPSYRCKRGRVVDKSPTGYCLEIETVNTMSDSGFSTLIGVTYPNGYEKIWFNADEVEDFETYDENGELVK